MFGQTNAPSFLGYEHLVSKFLSDACLTSRSGQRFSAVLLFTIGSLGTVASNCLQERRTLRIPQKCAEQRQRYSVGDDKYKDCPLCKKYGIGPCASDFWAWLNCTEDHPDNYVSDCKDLFQKFQQCESNHPDANNFLKSHGLDDCKREWQEFLACEIRDFPRSSFPRAFEPLVNQRGNLVQVFFKDPAVEELSLLAAVVQSGGEIVSASAASEMVTPTFGTKCLIAMTDKNNVQIVAIYADRDDNVVVFEQGLNLSP